VPTIKIFSKENCPRGRVLCNRLQNYGIVYEYHTAKFHSEYHEGWRSDDSTSCRAGIEYSGGELPILLVGDKIMTFEEAMKYVDDNKTQSIILYADSKGYDISLNILSMVKKNNFNCPCRINDVPCPCPGHEEEISKNGTCTCGLFTVKK